MSWRDRFLAHLLFSNVKPWSCCQKFSFIMAKTVDCGVHWSVVVCILWLMIVCIAFITSTVLRAGVLIRWITFRALISLLCNYMSADLHCRWESSVWSVYEMGWAFARRSSAWPVHCCELCTFCQCRSILLQWQCVSEGSWTWGAAAALWHSSLLSHAAKPPCRGCDSDLIIFYVSNLTQWLICGGRTLTCKVYLCSPQICSLCCWRHYWILINIGRITCITRLQCIQWDFAAIIWRCSLLKTKWDVPCRHCLVPPLVCLILYA